MVFVGWRWNGKLVEYLPEGIHEDIHLEAVYGKRPLISFETFEGARIADRQTNDAGKLDAFRPQCVLAMILPVGTLMNP